MPGGAPPGRLPSSPGGGLWAPGAEPSGSEGASVDSAPVSADGLFRALTSDVPPHDMASAASRAAPATRVLHRADIPDPLLAGATRLEGAARLLIPEWASSFLLRRVGRVLLADDAAQRHLPGLVPGLGRRLPGPAGAHPATGG